MAKNKNKKTPAKKEIKWQMTPITKDNSQLLQLGTAVERTYIKNYLAVLRTLGPTMYYLHKNGRKFAE